MTSPWPLELQKAPQSLLGWLFSSPPPRGLGGRSAALSPAGAAIRSEQPPGHRRGPRLPLPLRPNPPSSKSSQSSERRERALPGQHTAHTSQLAARPGEVPETLTARGL